MANPTGKGGFQPGQSGNPAGRPKKGETFTDLIREYGETASTLSENGHIISHKKALIKKMYEKALEGDAVMIKYIIDRIDGKPHEKMEIEEKNYIITPAP